MPFKTYLINKIQDKRFRINGIVPSRHLPHKHRLRQAFSQHRLYEAEQLPPKVDLRPYMTPVEDQSRIGSCTANSIAGAYEYLTKRATGRDIDVSRLFIYYNARVKGNKSETVEDTGCSMTDAIEALEEFGTCLESIWPYDISRVNTRPDDQAYQQAASHKINEALQVNIDLNEMKSCLAQGFPFAFGLKLYTSFDKAAQTGVVPMPNIYDGNRQSDGSHALLAVGYSDQSNAFIVRNSWGADWGDKGYCYIPYDYITNSDLCFDAWTVRKLANDDFGQEHWHSNDSVNYLHNQRNRYSDDTGDDDDDNHIIQGFDENDDDNDDYNVNNQNSWFNNNNNNNRQRYDDNYNVNDQNSWFNNNDNNRRRDVNDYSGSYQNYERNDYPYDYNQNTTYDDNDYNSDRNFPYDPYGNQRNNFDRYSDYN